MKVAIDSATTRFKQFIFEFVMVDVPFLGRWRRGRIGPDNFS